MFEKKKANFFDYLLLEGGFGCGCEVMEVVVDEVLGSRNEMVRIKLKGFFFFFFFFF